MSTQIDWIELIKDKKGVVTKDNQSCGNIIGDDEENIIILSITWHRPVA